MLSCDDSLHVILQSHVYYIVIVHISDNHVTKVEHIITAHYNTIHNKVDALIVNNTKS